MSATLLMPTGNARNPTDHKLHVLCRALWSNIEAAQSWRYRHALASTATCSSWMACALHCWNIYLPWMSPPTHATWATHRSLMVQLLPRSPLLSSACSVAAATHLLRAIHSLSCTVSQTNKQQIQSQPEGLQHQEQSQLHHCCCQPCCITSLN